MGMTLVELQAVLGERVEVAKNASPEDENYQMENEKSEVIARLAKQMINNADVILRTDKMRSEGKLLTSAISKVVGN